MLFYTNPSSEALLLGFKSHPLPLRRRRNAHYVFTRENGKTENMEESKWRTTKKMEKHGTKTANTVISLSFAKHLAISFGHVRCDFHTGVACSNPH
jgi:hypothetical protein